MLRNQQYIYIYVKGNLLLEYSLTKSNEKYKCNIVNLEVQSCHFLCSAVFLAIFTCIWLVSIAFQAWENIVGDMGGWKRYLKGTHSGLGEFFLLLEGITLMNYNNLREHRLSH